MSCNIMREYINFSRKCINNYIKIIMEKQFDANTTTDLLNTYIDVRYYDLYEKKYKKLEDNIGYHLLQCTYRLLEKSENTKEDRKRIKKIFTLFKYILYFDNVIDCKSAKTIIKEIDEFRIEKLNIKSDNFVNSFFEILKEDLNKKKEFIEQLDTKDFDIIYGKTNQNDVYTTSLEHHLKFPKIYSKYSINKAFVSKDINEQKLFVIYPMIVKKVLTNVISGDFKREYIVDYVTSIHSKPKKIKRLYNLIDDDISKEKIILTIHYSDYLTYKDQIQGFMREGFRYAVLLDNAFILNPDNLQSLKVFKYIIIKKEYVYFEDLKNLENIIIRR